MVAVKPAKSLIPEINFNKNILATRGTTQLWEQ